MKVAGLILAGGLSRRMGGGDKALRLLGGRPLVARVIERLEPQVETLVLNANGDPARFAHFGLPIAADGVAGYAGPLAGVLAGLDWTAEHRPDCDHVASVASDAPFLPPDLVLRLERALGDAPDAVACAASGGRAHPVFALWPVGLREDLRQAVLGQGIRKVDRFTARHPLQIVAFSAEPFDPFFNANEPSDLLAAEALLAHLSR